MGMLPRNIGSIALRFPLLAAAAVFLAAAPCEEPFRPIRVRLEWGGEHPEVWAGVLETSQGTITRPASLGVEADEVGSAWADGKSVWLQRNKPRTYDGFDATIIAPPTAH